MATLELGVFGFDAAQLERVQDAAQQSARFRASLGGYSAAAAANSGNPEAVAQLRDIVLESIPAAATRKRKSAQPSRKRKAAQSAAQEAVAQQSAPAAAANSGMAEQLLAMFAAMLQSTQSTPAQSTPAAAQEEEAQEEEAQPAKRAETLTVYARRAPLDAAGYARAWVLSASRNPDDENYYRFGTRGRSYQSASIRREHLRELLGLAIAHIETVKSKGVPKGYVWPLECQLVFELDRLDAELDRLCA